MRWHTAVDDRCCTLPRSLVKPAQRHSGRQFTALQGWTLETPAEPQAAIGPA